MYDAYDVFPEQIRNLPEFQSLERAVNRQLEKLNSRIDEMRDNILILTARESGIADREQILGIKPLETDTLEERRYRVMLRWYDTYPYTEADLRARLDRLCGKGTYKLNVDKENNTIACMMPVASQNLVRETWNLLDEILSLNVALKVGMHRKSSQMTYSGGALTVKRRYCVSDAAIRQHSGAHQVTYNGAATSTMRRYEIKEE